MQIPNINRYLLSIYAEPVLKVFKHFNLLGAGARYFLSHFCFSPNDSPSKTMNFFLFHLKSSFSSQDIQIFVFLSFTLLFPVSHCCERKQPEVDSRKILKFMTLSTV